MPGSPGAPSDIGPDGGLVDPGMIGPDGMPVDEGAPPGDDEGGGPPFGDDEEEDNGPPGAAGGGGGSQPPPAGDSKKDSSSSGPPPKGKGKKKGARAYLSIGGDRLTEDQFIRHMAVVASGAHPAVMARLRADRAPARRTAALREDTPENRGHYRRGWNASMRYTGTGDLSPLERADARDEPGAWYDGYHDYAGDRPKYHSLRCPSGDHGGDVPGCTMGSEQPQWHGGSDASRSPGFTARRAAS